MKKCTDGTNKIKEEGDDSECKEDGLSEIIDKFT